MFDKAMSPLQYACKKKFKMRLTGHLPPRHNQEHCSVAIAIDGERHLVTRQ